MALKRVIKKAEFDKLNEALQEFYTETGDKGEYTLDVEGVPDTSKLERSLEREKARFKEAKERADTAEGELQELKDAQTTEQKDVARLQKEYKTTVDKLTGDHKTALEKRDNFIRKSMRDTAASEMAREISTVPKIMQKAIAERLHVDFDDDEPRLVILDSEGKPSDIKMEQLKKEFLTNPEYKEIIIASRATGGRAKPGQDKGGPALPASNETDLSHFPTCVAAAALKPDDCPASWRPRHCADCQLSYFYR